jgi:CDP-glucose 4,6-dehydratase
MNAAFWNGKRVFLTGHTGFKGCWLAMWLAKMGAKVYGFALAPSTDPNLFALAGVGAAAAASTIADIRDSTALAVAMASADPEIIFHLAVQSLVRESYADPVGTYAVNVMGTAHVLDAARRLSNLKAVVIITTDKGYQNTDRLVPDILRGCFSPSGEVILRNPGAVRPWQHVLEPLSGYMMLAEKLASVAAGFDEGWNFGPPTEDVRPVRAVAEAMVNAVDVGRLVINQDPNAPRTRPIFCNSIAARRMFGWAGGRSWISHNRFYR